MESVIKKLGKTSITVEKDYHSSKKEYNKLTIVEEEGTFKTYLSRKPVPIGTELTNREYWIPFSGVLESITFDYLKFKQEYGSGERLEDNAIKTRHIENSSVTSNKILNGSVVNSKIADDTIEIEKLSTNVRNIIKAATVGRIDDIVESATIIDGTEIEPDAIVYVKDQKVFAARKGSEFSRYWVGDDAYMTSEREIRKDKLYTFNGAVYCWDSVSDSLVPSYSPLEVIMPTQIRTDYSENNVSLSLLHGQSRLFGDIISPATQKKAGVMSAEDKKKLDEIRNSVVFTGATVDEETEMLVLNRVNEETLVLDEVSGTLPGGITKVSQLENDKGYLTGSIEEESIILNND